MTHKKIISNLNVSALSPSRSEIVEIQPPRKAKDHASLLTNSAFPAYTIVGSYGGRDVEPAAIFDRLHSQADAVLQGDMSQVETMLLHNAIALQSMFSDLAIRAKKQSSLPAIQTLTQLALRAQSNCRATLQTLAEIKNPKQVAFVKQANIAQNQQINNGVPSPALAPARKIEVPQNELLVEENHGSKKVDARAKKKTSGSDPDLVAMDTVDRSTKSQGKAKRFP